MLPFANDGAISASCAADCGFQAYILCSQWLKLFSSFSSKADGAYLESRSWFMQLTGGAGAASRGDSVSRTCICSCSGIQEEYY